MSNPLIGMMMGNMGGMGRSNPMLGQIQQFASLIGSRNPEQMVRNLMRQRGIPESELQNAMRQAQDIARQMGIR